MLSRIPVCDVTQSANLSPKRNPKTPKGPTHREQVSVSREKCDIGRAIIGAMAPWIRHYSKNNALGGIEEQKSKRRRPKEMENACDDWDMVPHFCYIGVSKLSCSVCTILKPEWNDHRGQRFYTCGSHGKGYWPWGLPKICDELLGNVVDWETDRHRDPARLPDRLNTYPTIKKSNRSLSHTLPNEYETSPDAAHQGAAKR